jgi:hypothetical protein
VRSASSHIGVGNGPGVGKMNGVLVGAGVSLGADETGTIADTVGVSLGAADDILQAANHMPINCQRRRTRRFMRRL